MIRRAFTLIELMIVIAIVGVIAAIAIPQLAAKASAAAPVSTPEPVLSPIVESVISDRELNYVSHAKVLVLPTGERVFFVSGSHGMAVCTLPPLPAPKVER